MPFQSTYFNALRDQITSRGGCHNAHLHLDRAGTLSLVEDIGGSSHIGLRKKHQLIPEIHASSAYDPLILKDRVRFYLDAMCRCLATKACTLVDVTTDRVQLSALEVFLELKAEYRDQLDLQIGAYSPLGFRDDDSARWELLLQAAEKADFIGSLPERDDRIHYPEHIGFKEHCRRVIRLSRDLNKNLHIHVDQRNDPTETGSEQVLDVLDEIGRGNVDTSKDSPPKIWLVHVISPSCYEEDRFQKLIERFLDHRLGVICCPSAALSMRQLRPQKTPTHNSIARVLEFLAAGVPVRVGSDNICDITSPAATPDLMAEMYVLLNSIRYYDISIAAKIVCGLELTLDERNKISNHLEKDRQQVLQILS